MKLCPSSCESKDEHERVKHLWLKKMELSLYRQDFCISIYPKYMIANLIEESNSVRDLLRTITKNARSFEMITLT